MPVTRKDIPKMLESFVRRELFAAYNSIDESDYSSIAMEIASDGESENYAWLGGLPGMREFIDERIIKGLGEFSYSITNKTWESTIGVKREALEDDRTGQLRVRIQQLAAAAKRHKGMLVNGMLCYGMSTNCFDGTYMFNADHKIQGVSVSNYGTAALTAANLQTAYTAMKQYKNDAGEYMGITPNLLVVPPALEFTAKEILENTYLNVVSATINQNTKNPMYNIVGLHVSPYCNVDPYTKIALSSGGNSWYLLDTTKPVKPIILQNRIPLEVNSLEGNSDTGFMRDEYAYGVRARYNAGFGLWQLAYANKVA